MGKIVVTSGRKYIDIDAYAGCIAYSKLLNNNGVNSIPITTANYNESISKIITDLGLKLENYIPSIDDEFIILDVSNPDMFDESVNLENVVEIIDHHTGYENYWKERNIKADIEFIGSVCTIIFEKFEESNKVELLDENICKLLIAGILDNTLNLKASITTERDIMAYKKLLEIGKINNNWSEEYFISCQESIEKDLEQAIINDMKIEYVNDFLPKVFGQLLVFDKTSIIENIELIKDIFNRYDKDWMLNLISLKDGKSYIYASTENVINNLEILFSNKFNRNLLILDKFMLRKEIMKMARERK